MSKKSFAELVSLVTSLARENACATEGVVVNHTTYLEDTLNGLKALWGSSESIADEMSGAAYADYDLDAPLTNTQVRALLDHFTKIYKPAIANFKAR